MNTPELLAEVERIEEILKRIDDSPVKDAYNETLEGYKKILARRGIEARSESEMLENFMNSIEGAIKYWSTQDVSSQLVAEGVAFTILNIIDGNCGAFPCSIDLTLCPDPDDKQYYIEHDMPYVEKGMVINNCQLHELLNH